MYNQPVAEIKACEHNSLKFLFLYYVFIGHVSHQEIHKYYVRRIYKGNVLQKEIND